MGSRGDRTTYRTGHRTVPPKWNPAAVPFIPASASHSSRPVPRWATTLNMRECQRDRRDKTAKLTGLPSLPPELIDSILAYLPASAFHSFRLVCARLRELSFYTFKCRFFYTRKLDWTTKDLETLLRISSHGILGPCVKSLVINGTDYQRMRENAPTFHRLFWSEENDDIVRFNQSVETMAQNIKLLKDAFDNLYNLKSITFFYDKKVVPSHGYDPNFFSHYLHDISAFVAPVLHALGHSNLQLEELRQDSRCCKVAITRNQLHDLWPLFPYLHISFAALRTSQLNFMDRRSIWLQSNTDLTLQALALAYAKNLQELDMTSSYQSHVVFEKIAKIAKPRVLVKCRLDHWYVTVEDLAEFLKHSKATLRDLTLGELTVVNGDRWRVHSRNLWPSFMIFLAENFRLERLLLEENHIGDMGCVYYSLIGLNNVPCTSLLLEKDVEEQLRVHARKLVISSF